MCNFCNDMDHSPFKRIAEFGKEHCPTCKPDNHKRLEELRNRHAKDEARKKYHDALIKETKTNNAYRDYKSKRDHQKAWEGLGKHLLGDVAPPLAGGLGIEAAALLGQEVSSPKSLSGKAYRFLTKNASNFLGGIGYIADAAGVIDDNSIADHAFNIAEKTGKYLKDKTQPKAITGKKKE